MPTPASGGQQGDRPPHGGVLCRRWLLAAQCPKHTAHASPRGTGRRDNPLLWAPAYNHSPYGPMLLAAALRARATGAARAVLAAHHLPARAQHTPSPSGQPSFPYVAAGDGVDSAAFTVVRKDGADIIHDPLTNKA